MLPEIFATINGVIALCYGLIALYLVTRIKLPGGVKNGWRVVLAFVFAAAFFIGCAHTHFDIMIHANRGELGEHWYDFWSIFSHAAQAIGGLGFFVLATLWLELQIYDKHDYDRNKEQVKEIFKKNDN
jgi:hypothetical protein